MVRHGMVFHSVNSETKPCRTMPWARFRLDSPLGTFNMNDDVKVLKGAPANTREKNDDRPLPNLLLRGHVVDTEWDEVKVEKPAISQQVLDKTFKDKVIGHSRGLITEAQLGRGMSARNSPTLKSPWTGLIFISGQKGSKRTQEYDPPNQDHWSVTAFKSGWTLFCVHDGHGPYGHYVSKKDGPNGTMEPHRGEWLWQGLYRRSRAGIASCISKVSGGPGSLCSGEQGGRCRKRQHGTSCAFWKATKSGHRTLAIADAWLVQRKCLWRKCDGWLG